MISRQYIELNLLSVIFIIVSCILNGIQYSNTAINNMELTSKVQKNVTQPEYAEVVQKLSAQSQNQPDFSKCPTNINCESLPFPCISCNYNHSCVYGKPLTVTCDVKPTVQCTGSREFQQSMICRYCWQTERWEQKCEQKDNCNSANHFYFTNCTVNPEQLCLGNRTFQRKLRCNWTQGYRWSTALLMSITLGGFGIDRFYLGHWQEGIGKLFSFGGLGVWTLVDVILISLHHLGPADGSLYL